MPSLITSLAVAEAEDVLAAARQGIALVPGPLLQRPTFCHGGQREHPLGARGKHSPDTTTDKETPPEIKTVLSIADYFIHTHHFVDDC